MNPTRYQVHGDIAVITMDNPPVNGLGLDLRRGVSEGIEAAQADGQVRAVIIIGTANGLSDETFDQNQTLRYQGGDDDAELD